MVVWFRNGVNRFFQLSRSFLVNVVNDQNNFDDEFFTFPTNTAQTVNEKLKRAQSLVGTSEGRPEHDFYPTPPEATEALLAVEKFEGTIWEPACGDGAISKVLIQHGHEVISTDLIDRGYGTSPHDFLTSTRTAANIITNPPFKLAEQFTEHAMQATTGKVAMLCKLQWLEGGKRKTMFERLPLKKVYVFSKRLSMTRNGIPMKNSGMIAFAWYVFQHRYDGQPQLGWL